MRWGMKFEVGGMRTEVGGRRSEMGERGYCQKKNITLSFLILFRG